GSLLAEIQRIKSEGDFEAARSIVEQYGVKISRQLHEEILTRYKTLNIAPYKGFLNPRLAEQKDAEGNVIDISIEYAETYAEQMLRYSTEYSCL
ncbi:MAG: dihydrofolate reductase, partial [Prevotella sp.]|nr:dihydrofolate reductase [Prevotella sp.]